MSKEYIERNALLDDLRQSRHELKYVYNSLKHESEKMICAAELNTFLEIMLRIKDTPAADVVEVKHGEWISDDGDVLFHCSECEAQISTSWDYESDWGYCPNCGAKMDGERKDLKGERNGDKH